MHNILEYHVIKPFQAMGLTHAFWNINIDTLLYTWAACILIISLALGAQKWIERPNTITGYFSESYTRAFIRMITQTIGHFEYRYIAFIGSLFTFILINNIMVIFPFMEESTKDLNTTFALAICSFIYVQKEGIRAHGIGGYVKEFFKPIAIFFPLEILGKLATIISLSFRLFGNIFGGSIISSMWHYAISGSILAQLAGLLLGINLLILLFFGVFEGLVQAFVFSILTLTYLSMAVQEAHG